MDSKTFSYILRSCLSIVFIFSNFKNFYDVQFVCFFLVLCAFGVMSNKALHNPGSLRFTPFFFFVKSLKVLALILVCDPC